MAMLQREVPTQETKEGVSPERVEDAVLDQQEPVAPAEMGVQEPAQEEPPSKETIVEQTAQAQAKVEPVKQEDGRGGKRPPVESKR